ncbi:hypothetical protein M409DRAFT_16478 [Zasmidium cellare ATCC 36951]|uniref:DAPG hydrolase PhiG domain-containing protein n=1 Tax=Zasmidium cellare ATCC 36951 TaxID=1080233 RepID=A0A6A6D7J6_ZASCE|nr:uncharacterized protein M409DRAFT_16478 [Zasmidium cellare ATCC 36951]KAF2174212.1 hypothetical protein M409DRAFT_16478 [Zasmidium cellare ATCC 36951]
MILAVLTAALVAAIALIATTTSIPSELALFVGNPLQPLGARVNQKSSEYYIGYRGSDFDKPWAKSFNDNVSPVDQDFIRSLERSPVPASQGVSIRDAGEALNQPGYLPLEDGYTFLDDGTLLLAIRSEMPPNFSGEMYDFWFSWHMNDTTKYKLWHPKQHQYAATTYRTKLWGTTSFVSEYIGATADKISISFFDPSLLNFTTTNPSTGVETLVAAFAKTFRHTKRDATAMAKRGFKPWDTVLIHQVRRTPDGGGYEVRSRFWLGSWLVRRLRVVGDPEGLARDLCVHCREEMTHLGRFLPGLFGEFGGDVST